MYAHTDPLGHTEYFFYDQADRQAVMVDANGNESLVAYEGQGRATSSIDPLGNETKQSWDGDPNLNHVASVTDARGMQTSWDYDTLGNATSETFDDPNDADPAETNWTRSYETSPSEYSRPLTATDQEGNTTDWDYTDPTKVVQVFTPDSVKYPGATPETSEEHLDNHGQVIKSVSWRTDSEGQQVAMETLYDYDATSGALESMTDPENNVTDYVPDAQGRIQQVIDPANQSITLSYDARDRMETASTSTGQTISIAYDDAGRRESMTTPRGTTSYVYDDAGRMIQQTNPDGGVIVNTYDPAGNLIARTDPRGNTSRFAYDALGRTKSRTTPDGKSWTTGFCADILGGAAASAPCPSCTGGGGGGLGAVCELYGPDGTLLVTNDLDDRGRVAKTTDALGHWMEYEYDEQGRKILERYEKTLWDANDDPYLATLEKTYEYDAEGNLTAVVEANGARTEYEYDEAENLIKRRQWTDNADPLTEKLWLYGYDSLGRMTFEENPLGLRTQYAYDALGKRIIQLHPDGSAVRHYYDLAAPDGDDNHRTLDEIRVVVEDTIPDGADGHPDMQTALTKPRSEWSWEAEFEYDGDSRRTRMENAHTKKTYTYTPDGKPATVTDWGLDGDLTDADETLTYTYDLSGNRKTMSGPQGTTEYHYDATGRLIRMLDPWTGAFTFDYDDYGRRDTLGYPNGVTTSYDYDLKGQLLSILAVNQDQVVVDAWTYTYDEVGNRLDKTDKDGGVEGYQYDATDRLTYASYPWSEWERFAYDDVGNRIELHDQDKDVTYSYDDANRIEQEIWDFLDGSPDETIDYTFDERGNRNSKVHHLASGDHTVTLDWDIQNRLDGITDSVLGAFAYEYDPTGIRSRAVEPSNDDRLLYDREDVISEYDSAGQLSYWYTHGPGIDEPIAMQEVGGASSTLHADALGSITKSAGLEGELIGYSDRRAYGHAVAEGAIAGRYGFTGREISTSELLYYRTRYYATSQGAFLSRDVVDGNIVAPLSHNKYLYGAANPARYVDPNGTTASEPELEAAFLLGLSVLTVMTFIIVNGCDKLRGLFQLAEIAGSALGGIMNQSKRALAVSVAANILDVAFSATNNFRSGAGKGLDFISFIFYVMIDLALGILIVRAMRSYMGPDVAGKVKLGIVSLFITGLLAEILWWDLGSREWMPPPDPNYPENELPACIRQVI